MTRTTSGWRIWRRQATVLGRQEIGRSQMYKSDSGCRNGMKSVAKNAADSAVVEEEA